MFEVMFRKILLLLILAFCSTNGQDLKDSTEFVHPNSLQFKWSNDFEYQTDYYFTNGFAFEYFAPWIKENMINSILLPVELSDFELYGITLIQDIFTPKERYYIPDQLDGDRPFATYLLLGFKRVSFNPIDKISIYSELQVGMLGPAASGEEVQNGIHNNLPTSDLVVGWENQISNSFMLNYSASIEKQFYYNNWMDISGISLVKLGLPFTNLNLGIKTRIGLFDFLPKEFEFCSNRKWQLFLTLAASGSFIGYNATLQGGLFSESVYTLSNINRIVGHANIGLTVVYKKFELEYIQHFNTPEFSEAFYHSWGYLLIKVGF